VTSVEHPAADRAAAYGLERILIDGNDADEVYLTAAKVIASAREGQGPSLVEALTYRHGGHSRADPGKYRPDEEVKAWLARDPIPRLRERMIAEGVEEAKLQALEEQARAKVSEAEEEARAGAEPTEEVLETQVWADGGSAWRS
jgi:TPP-dependent pyruvate/acetoin dehydrogenase alpha subunit